MRGASRSLRAARGVGGPAVVWTGGQGARCHHAHGQRHAGQSEPVSTTSRSGAGLRLAAAAAGGLVLSGQWHALGLEYRRLLAVGDGAGGDVVAPAQAGGGVAGRPLLWLLPGAGLGAGARGRRGLPAARFTPGRLPSRPAPGALGPAGHLEAAQRSAGGPQPQRMAGLSRYADATAGTRARGGKGVSHARGHTGDDALGRRALSAQRLGRVVSSALAGGIEFSANQNRAGDGTPGRAHAGDDPTGAGHAPVGLPVDARAHAGSRADLGRAAGADQLCGVGGRGAAFWRGAAAGAHETTAHGATGGVTAGAGGRRGAPAAGPV